MKRILIVLLSILLFAAIACDMPVQPPVQQPTQTACGSEMLAVPSDPAETGPWPAGTRTITSIGNFKTQIWYPAQPGSEAGKQKFKYDMREYLPNVDPSVSMHETNSYEGLPLDTAHGPYPVIIYVHGTGAFRFAHHIQTTHWASRGFVVLIADNPNIMFGDMIKNMIGVMRATQAADTQKIIAAVHSPSGGLAFLAGHIAADRIGLSGHSAGGGAIARLGSENGVRVIIPMAAGGVADGSSIESAMIMGGTQDRIAAHQGQISGYNNCTVRPKRLVGIQNMGHMGFANICDSVLSTDDLGIDLSSLERVANDGCGPAYLNQEDGWEIINYATTAAFEETLMCSDAATQSLANIENAFGNNVDYKSAN